MQKTRVTHYLQQLFTMQMEMFLQQTALKCIQIQASLQKSAVSSVDSSVEQRFTKTNLIKEKAIGEKPSMALS